MKALPVFLLAMAMAACAVTDPEKAAQLTTPINLTASTTTGNAVVDLRWEPGAAMPAGAAYRIYRAEQSFSMQPAAARKKLASQRDVRRSSFRMLAEVTAATVTETAEVTFQDTTVTLGAEYFYRVTAFLGDRETEASGLARVTAGFPGVEGPRNHAPNPTAPPISVQINQTGTSKVDPGDVDADDEHTFVITVAPLHGSATIDADGLVTYTPANETYKGADSLTVQVTDLLGNTGTITVPVAIDFIPVTPGFSAVPNSLCGDGKDRVNIIAISPAPKTVLPYDTEVTLTATISYSVPTTTSIRLQGSSYVANGSASALTPGPLKEINGCGQTDVTFTVTTSSAVSGVVAIAVRLDAGEGNEFYFPIGAADSIPSMQWISANVAPGTVFTANYDFNATFGWSIPSALAGDTHQDHYGELSSSYGTYYGNWFYPGPLSGQRKVRIRGTLECGQTEIVISSYVNGVSPSIYSYLLFPVRPPEIAVDNFLTEVPVIETTTVDIRVEDCLESAASARTVSFTPSAAWFTVSPTQGTLPQDITVTYDASKIPAGQKVAGELTIAPLDESFPAVKVAVSARGYAYDLANWTMLAINDEDDGYEEITLSFDFPFGGGETTRSLFPNTNGAVFAVDGYTDYEVPNGSFDHLDPDYYGVPILAPYWIDNRFDYFDNAVEDGVYFRETTDATGHHAELLYWDLDSYNDLYEHNVVLMKIYPNGTWTVEYPQITPIGWENIGYYTAGGVANLLDVWAIEPGKVYQFGPIP